MKSRSAAIRVLCLAMIVSIYHVICRSFAVGADYGPSDDERRQAEPYGISVFQPCFRAVRGLYRRSQRDVRFV